MHKNQSEFSRYHYFLKKFSHQGEPVFAGHLLARSAQEYPHRPALHLADHTISYAELFRQSLCVSRALHKLGITRKSRVILLIDNSAFFYQSYYGAWQLGTVVIPLNVFLKTEEIVHIIADAQPDIIIVAESLKSKIEGIENPPKILHEHDLTDLASSPHSSPAEDASSILATLTPDETAVILYTSGTTGFPKGVMLSSRVIISNICQLLARLRFIPDEKILCPLPLFHSFTQITCVWGAIAVGVSVIVIPKITRSALVEGIQQQPTIVLGIPGLYAILCKLKNISFPNVRYFVSGGEPLTTNIRRFFALRFGRTLVNGYGLTESGPVIAADLQDYHKPTHTIGQPLIDIKCDIRNPDEQGIGTLWVSGPNLMLGYFNAPEATATVLHNGWLNTGDMATMQPDGTLVIGGREKDIIIQKGIKIYPQEIETALCTHHDVVLAAVIGVPYQNEGEFPVAYVQLIEDSTATPEELREHCQQRLAVYKIPRQVYIKSRLPMTATGKVNKKQLTTKTEHE